MTSQATLIEQIQEAQKHVSSGATQRQSAASNPLHSVWVGASAGTGKTKVLTDRLLRLLLPNDFSENGTPPHQILCITFTKAAAAEMALRLNKILSKWATLSDDALADELVKLLEKEPSEAQLKKARSLFATLIDSAQSLNIMTIHSFCESILRRFAVEAGLTPGFEVIEPEQSKALLEEAQTQFFEAQLKDKKGTVAQKLINLSTSINDDRFLELLNTYIGERRSVEAIFETRTEESLLPEYLDILDLDPQINEQDSLEKVRASLEKIRPDMKQIMNAFEDAGKYERNISQALDIFLAQSTLWTQKDLEELFGFVATEGSKRKLTKKAVEHQTQYDLLFDILKNYFEKINRLKVAQASQDILVIAHRVLETYRSLKEKRGVLDFDDLIERTSDLLAGRLINGQYKNAFEWILFKLDRGIDHILVDEAQDTNPDQWSVIKSLTDSFLSGDAARENIHRSLFVVGDEKQSIYSFQRADPQIFNDKRANYEKKFLSVQKDFKKIDLNVSFRSVPAILSFVDKTFANQEASQGLSLSNQNIQHEAYRLQSPGCVELWNAIPKPEKQECVPWELPPLPEEVEQSPPSGNALNAKKIAGTISNWLMSRRVIGATGKRVQPGDILILLQERGALQNEIVRALKAHNIPVEGIDRMVITDHIAVQDLIAAAKFACLPQDDFTLSCLLKSPFIGWDDTQLMALAFQRENKKSLYETLQKGKGDEYGGIFAWLQNLHFSYASQTPYTFFSALLATPCPASEVNGWTAFYKRFAQEATDPLESFLNYALNWKNTKGRTSLQGFLQDVEKNKNEVKREMEESSNRVRIMTVHGSKGLQSPIVFLADATKPPIGRGNRVSDSVFWKDVTDHDLPIWLPSGEFSNDKTDAFKARAKEKTKEEHKRLFYVAMTRAADELYITGVSTAKEVNAESWYAYAEQTMEALASEKGKANITYNENESGVHYGEYEEHVFETEADTNKHFQEEKLPRWIHESAREEREISKTLKPSLGEVIAENETVISPLSNFARPKHDPRFHRGNIIHALLQFLPDVSHKERHTKLSSYLAQKHLGLDEATQEEIHSEVIGLLNTPKFKDVFGPDARAEIPITGILEDGTKITGQIDRLLVTDTDIIIVDFKTNRPPPKKVEDVDKLYRDQLRAYKTIIEKIYPHRSVRCGLLWTNTATLMEIDV